MKMSDNELEQKKYEKEILNYKKKLSAGVIKERQERINKIKILENKQKKILKEIAKLRKKDRNRRDYLLHSKKLGDIDKIVDEICCLELKIKKRQKENYRKDSGSCYCINHPFKGCEGHHIDKDTIVYIPKQLHNLIKHSLKTGKGMKETNENVFKWLRQ